MDAQRIEREAKKAAHDALVAKNHAESSDVAVAFPFFLIMAGLLRVAVEIF
jgi:hypothetical protein